MNRRDLAALFLVAALGCSLSPARGEPVPVTVVPLGKLLFHPAREAPANVVSLNDALISAEIAAKVETVARRPGDEVRAGDLLARLDCTTYRIARKKAEAALEAARARFRYARKRVEDAQKLVKSRNISSDEYNQRSAESNRLAAEVNVREADLEEARWREARCRVTAPFDAVVVERRASQGDYATVGTPILRLVDLTHLEVSALVQRQDLEAMRQARRLEFRMGDHHYPLRLRAVIPMLKKRVHSQEVRFIFQDRSAPPGAAGRLYWEEAEPQVPARYLVQREGQLGLFVAEQGKARFHPLPDAVQGLPAAVDLPPETLVIDAGRFSVQAGDTVKVVEP